MQTEHPKINLEVLQKNVGTLKARLSYCNLLHRQISLKMSSVCCIAESHQVQSDTQQNKAADWSHGKNPQKRGKEDVLQPKVRGRRNQ